VDSASALPTTRGWEKDPYGTLPSAGPYEVAIGSALITMVEPHLGYEAAYNRWYEDDHFYAGAMAEPWMFAGRRWVAPTALQALREPRDSPICRPLSRGKWISTYWITRGRYLDHFHWTAATNARLRADNRSFPHRDNMFTAFYEYAGPVYRDASGPRDIHALNYPYRGLVVDSINAGDASRRVALVHWLMREHLPARLAGSSAAMCLLFTPIPVDTQRVRSTGNIPGWESRVVVLWFLETEPWSCWQAQFQGLDEASARSGWSLELRAPFIPTLPGTDTYLDQLR